MGTAVGDQAGQRSDSAVSRKELGLPPGLVGDMASPPPRTPWLGGTGNASRTAPGTAHTPMASLLLRISRTVGEGRVKM
jgi:hypothetical protein